MTFCVFFTPAIPDIDENDLNLAQSLSLEYREVVDESDKLKNSEQVL